MGNSAIRAKENTIDEQTKLDNILNEFDKEIQRILSKYGQGKYSKPTELCQRLSWQYVNAILPDMFQESTLDGIAVKLGLDVEKWGKEGEYGDQKISPKAESYKKNLCETIAGFYLQKIEAVLSIQNTLKGCNGISKEFIREWEQGVFKEVEDLSFRPGGRDATINNDRIRVARDAYKKLKELQKYTNDSKERLREFVYPISRSRDFVEQRALIRDANIVQGEITGVCNSYLAQLNQTKSYVSNTNVRPTSPTGRPVIPVIPPVQRSNPPSPPVQRSNPPSPPPVQRSNPPSPPPAQRQIPAPPAQRQNPPAPPAQRQNPPAPPAQRSPPPAQRSPPAQRQIPPAQRQIPAPPPAQRQIPAPPAQRQIPAPPPAQRSPPVQRQSLAQRMEDARRKAEEYVRSPQGQQAMTAAVPIAASLIPGGAAVLNAAQILGRANKTLPNEKITIELLDDINVAGYEAGLNSEPIENTIEQITRTPNITRQEGADLIEKFREGYLKGQQDKPESNIEAAQITTGLKSSDAAFSDRMTQILQEQERQEQLERRKQEEEQQRRKRVEEENRLRRENPNLDLEEDIRQIDSRCEKLRNDPDIQESDNTYKLIRDLSEKYKIDQGIFDGGDGIQILYNNCNKLTQALEQNFRQIQKGKMEEF